MLEYRWQNCDSLSFTLGALNEPVKFLHVLVKSVTLFSV